MGESWLSINNIIFLLNALFKLKHKKEIDCFNSDIEKIPL